MDPQDLKEARTEVDFSSKVDEVQENGANRQDGLGIQLRHENEGSRMSRGGDTGSMLCNGPWHGEVFNGQP